MYYVKLQSPDTVVQGEIVSRHKFYNDAWEKSWDLSNDPGTLPNEYYWIENEQGQVFEEEDYNPFTPERDQENHAPEKGYEYVNHWT